MENHQSRSMERQPALGPLKESIRDMVRLQRDHQISDELFWEVFNTRVLLNEKINVNEFVRDFEVPVLKA